MPKLSLEATVGIMLEIVLAILDHLHIREPLIVWGLFILGLILISDSILRSDWARTPTEKAARTKRRTYGMLPVVILFSIFGYYIFKVERPIPTGSIDKSEPPIPANKQPDTNQAPETKPAQQLHAEKKKPRPTTTQPPATPPSQVCPNGICVGGDNNGTATVNNNYGKLPDQPQPGTIPTVIVCSSISAVGKGYVTNITLQTDSPITKPAYGFLFDGPVGGGEISISGIPKPKVPYVNQLQLQGYEDRSYVLRFISEDFPNGSDVWQPGVIFKVKLPSQTKVALVGVLGTFGSEQKELFENRKFVCDVPTRPLHLAPQ